MAVVLKISLVIFSAIFFLKQVVVEQGVVKANSALTVGLTSNMTSP